MNIKKLILSCFGLGFLPIAPGTFGSLLPVGLFLIFHYFWPSTGILSAVLAAMAIVSSILCLSSAGEAEKIAGKKDPGWVVIDEFAGQSIALLPIAFMTEKVLLLAIAAFVLFRIFDILKPWPICKLEKLPGGIGILADDLLAGVYAGIILLVFSQFHNVLWAALLGAVQGLTEFLPVSSSGHLVLIENLFGLDPEKPEMLLFDLAIHTGTVFAIFIVFRKSIIAFISNLFAFSKYGSTPVAIYKRSPSVHLIVLAMATTFVTSVLGLLLKDYFESARGSLGVIAGMWVINATVLLITDCRGRTHLSLRRFGLTAAVIVGLAQTVAIMPGISRSGATICAAILLGLRRRWAVEFSFLIAIPAILGATLVESIKNFDKISSATLPLSSIIVGPVVAAVVGILALKVLIKVSRKANLKFFAIYCYILAAAVAVYLMVR